MLRFSVYYSYLKLVMFAKRINIFKLTCKLKSCLLKKYVNNLVIKLLLFRIKKNLGTV